MKLKLWRKHPEQANIATLIKICLHLISYISGHVSEGSKPKVQQHQQFYPNLTITWSSSDSLSLSICRDVFPPCSSLTCFCNDCISALSLPWTSFSLNSKRCRVLVSQQVWRLYGGSADKAKFGNQGITGLYLRIASFNLLFCCSSCFTWAFAAAPSIPIKKKEENKLLIIILSWCK